MGAGNFPVGSGPAGFDPSDITPATGQIAATAWLFDPFAHDIPVDENGDYVECHPVDSEMMLAIGLPLGSVKSAPAIGGTLAALPISDSSSMTADATRRVQTAASDLLSAGDVTILLVNAWAGPNWRAHLELKYVNNRMPSATAADRETEILLGGV